MALDPRSVLVTMDDVGKFGSQIHKGLGLWVHYILSRWAQESELNLQNGEYHLKSIPSKKPISKFVQYLKGHGIKVIIPTGVHDAAYLSRHRQQIEALGVRFLACDDPDLYRTLDHKWLSHVWITDRGLPQPTSLPLREDTRSACQELAQATCPNAVFIKQTSDTQGGEGVVKVTSMKEYEVAVQNKFAPADSPDINVNYMLQVGHPGTIVETQSIWYKGELVSTYVSQAPSTANYGSLRKYFLLGPLNGENIRTATRVEDPEQVNQVVSMLKRIGNASNYTGMMDVEFFMPEDSSSSISILEFNPRFSGEVHASLTSGFLDDYMELLLRQLSPSDKRTLEQLLMPNCWPLIRSNDHEPDTFLQNYNLVGFYAARVKTLGTLKCLKVRQWKHYAVGDEVESPI